MRCVLTLLPGHGYKNLCNRLPSYYLLARRRGWLSKLLGRSRGVSVRKVCVTFCYVARAVLDNDATTFVGLPDYNVLVLLQFFWNA